jgi:hypothetical protein
MCDPLFSKNEKEEKLKYLLSRHWKCFGFVILYFYKYFVTKLSPTPNTDSLKYRTDIIS